MFVKIFILIMVVNFAFGEMIFRNTGRNVGYKVSQDALRWIDAADYCQSEGGHLAHILSAEDQAFIEFLLESVDPEGTQNFWMGLSDVFNEGVYTWLPGNVPTTYTNWYTGQPDEIVLHDFVHIMPLVTYSRKWADSHNDYYYRAICEIEL